MGYGGLPNFTEYDPSGHVLLDGTLGKNVQSFRTYLDPWSGQAPGVPSVAVSGSSVAVSWNGATNVASWQVLGGRLGDGARAGREGREGGLPDDDLGAGRRCLRRRAGARLERRGARDLGHSQGLVPARPCPPARRRLIVRALSACLARRSGSRRSPRGARARAGRCEREQRRQGGAPRAARPSPSCVPQTLNVSAALAGGRVTVSPGPGVRDASTATQISFLGVPAADLSQVVVRGSRSGAHAGSLRAYSEGDGASFVPAKPFTPGELVTVHAVLGEAGRSTPFAWSFTVAVPDNPGAADVTESTRLDSAPPAPKEYQSFHSRPELRPPDVTVSSTARTASGGDLFLAPYSGVGQYGPMILNEHGELVWFKSLSPAGTRAANLRVQEYEGKPALTWWQDPLDRRRIEDGGRGDREQRLPDDRDRPRRQRLPAGPARIPDHPAGHRADHRLRRDRLQPLIGRRPARRRRRGHAAAGDRPEDGPRDVRVAQPRPRAPRELLRVGRADEQGRTVRLLPHQLDRRRAGRRPAGRLAQHLGGVRRRPEDRPGALGAGRQALELQAGPRRHPGVAARRAPAARRRDHVLRQRRDPRRAPAVARDRTGARHGEHDGDARAQLRAREPARRRQPGQRAGARKRRLDGRLGPGRLPLGGQPRRPGSLQRPPAAGLGVLPDLRVPLERPAGRTAGAGGREEPASAAGTAGGKAGARAATTGRRLRELERRDRSRLLAGARGILAELAGAGRDRPEERLRDGDRDPRLGERATTSRCRRSTAPAR